MESDHSHGPGCACAAYALIDKDDDLFECIDVENVRCLNEDVNHSCRNVFRSFEHRLDSGNPPYLKPPAGDSEILLIVPFREEVKVRAIVLYSGVVGKPSEVNLYSNKENFDFSLTEEEDPVHKIALNGWTSCGGIQALTQYNTFNDRILKFPRVYKLILHIKGAHDFDLKYVGIKGIRTHVSKL